MAVTGLPFKGNASVVYNSQTIGGLRSATCTTTQGTWDSTAFDNTSGARTHSATYHDSTMSLSGVLDGDVGGDAGQVATAAAVTAGAAYTLTVTFATGMTFACSAICTDFSVEGDYEGGWTWTASFQQAGAPTWDITA